ncbi:MAG: hypothetical protein ACQES5_02570 [Thermodesulfobacteriota bacterium]
MRMQIVVPVLAAVFVFAMYVSVQADGMIEGTPQTIGQCQKMPHPPIAYSSSTGEKVESVGYLRMGSSPAMFAIVLENGKNYRLLKTTGTGSDASSKLAEGSSLQGMLQELETRCK